MHKFTLSININPHDSSVSVFRDDVLVFMSSFERFSRKKYDYVPKISVIEDILNNITKNINLCVVSGNQFSIFHDKIDFIDQIKKLFHRKNVKCEYFIDVFNNMPMQHSKTPNVKLIYPKEKYIDYFTHHDVHALSAFYMSPFDDAVCLIIDSGGTVATAGYVAKNSLSFSSKTGKYEKSVDQQLEEISFIIHETASIIELEKNYKRKNIYKRVIYSSIISGNKKIFSDKKIQDYFRQVDFPIEYSTHMDIGKLYSFVTKSLGFNGNDSGKTMGLSAYGNSKNNLPEVLAENTTWSNSNLIPIKYTTADRPGQRSNFFNEIYPELQEQTFQIKADMAYNLQKGLEKVFLKHAKFIYENSKKRNLVISGGCGLNILGVALIKKHYPEFNIFVDPICNDANQSIGLGIHFYNKIFKNYELEKQNNFSQVYTGFNYDIEKNRADLQKMVAAYKSHKQTIGGS